MMDPVQRSMFLAAVRQATATDPSILRPLVEAATEGVKAYADHQSDIGTRAQFVLMCILDAVQPPQDGKFGAFTVAEAVNALAGCFEGTEGLAKLRAKYAVEKPPDDPEAERIGTTKGWGPT